MQPVRMEVSMTRNRKGLIADLHCAWFGSATESQLLADPYSSWRGPGCTTKHSDSGSSNTCTGP